MYCISFAPPLFSNVLKMLYAHKRKDETLQSVRFPITFPHTKFLSYSKERHAEKEEKW